MLTDDVVIESEAGAQNIPSVFILYGNIYRKVFNLHS